MVSRRDYQQFYHSQPEQKKRRARTQRLRRLRRRMEILLRDGFRCAYCLACFCHNVKVLTVDHKWPLSQQGHDAPWNKITACSPCNRKKGTLGYEAYMARIREDYVPGWVTGDDPLVQVTP